MTKPQRYGTSGMHREDGMIDIEELERLAKAATPGSYQWTTNVDHDGPPSCDVIMAQAVVNDCWEELCTFAWDEKPKYHPIDRSQAEANAAYAVASNPAAILTLIAEVRALREDSGKPGVRIDRYSIPESGAEIIRTDQRTGPAKWKVFKDGYCLSKSGDWEYEPMPSSRTDDFIGRCRFDSAQEAIDAARGAK